MRHDINDIGGADNIFISFKYMNIISQISSRIANSCVWVSCSCTCASNKCLIAKPIIGEPNIMCGIF